MAYLNPDEAFEDLRSQVVDAVKTHFPIKGRTLSLHLDDVAVDDTLKSNDIRSQHKAKIDGKTWAVPVYATMSLRDNLTGKTLEQKRMRLMELPRPTERYSYIVDGQEYQVDNQWQLKPGVYARRTQSGDLVSEFNVVGRNRFKVVFDPATKQFTVEYKKANLPLYPLIKTLGVSDDALEQSWGKEILTANKNAKKAAGALEQFYKTTTGKPAPSKKDAENMLLHTMGESKLSPATWSSR